jgi:uncharacterized repeat protein (TIGR03803 family)
MTLSRGAEKIHEDVEEKMSRVIQLAVALASLCGGAAAFGETFTTLYDFGGVRGDGEDPQSGVVFDRSGNLWGFASLGGGRNGTGTIFELIPPIGGVGPWTEVTVHRFQDTPDGDTPESRPVVTPGGVLHGTTYLGGANRTGTAFQAIPPTTPDAPWIVRVIHDFGVAAGDGQHPNASLLFANGVFYGVTQDGGATGRGTVFSLSPPAQPGGDWTETILYSFRAVPDAAFPSSELALDADGNLYGNALQGGVNNLGAVYRLAPPAVPGGRWTESVIHSFNGTDGTLPIGRLIFDDEGALYGTTSGGGAREGGTVFRIDPPAVPGDPWTQEVLFAFSGGRDGGSPDAGVTMDRQGRLFGVTENGGNGVPIPSGGVVFVLEPPGEPGGVWTETVLHAFGGNDGFRPIAPLLLRNGTIYGTTAQGGAFGTGTAFSLSFP